jgi:hypothetical protein
MKGKKASLTLSIIAVVLVAVAFLLLFLTPTIMGASSYMYYNGLDKGFKVSGMDFWKTTRGEFFNFAVYKTYPIMWAFLIGGVLIGALWIVHLIMMIVHKRGNSTFVDLAWIIGGLLALDLLVYGFMPGVWQASVDGKAITDPISAAWRTNFEAGNYASGSFKNVIAWMKDASTFATFSGTSVAHTAATGGTLVVGLLPYILGAVALILLIIAVIISIVDVAKNRGGKKKADLAQEPAAEEKPQETAKAKAEEDEDAAYRKALDEELDDRPQPTTVNSYGYTGPQPGIIQYITYGGKGGEGPMDNNYVTKDEMKKVIRDELAAYFKKEEPKEDKPAEVSSNNMLTSDDLREIIREEMGTSSTGGGMKASELRQLIAEEVAKALAADREAAAKANAEREARDAALASQVKASNDEVAAVKGNSLKPEEVRTIVSQELDKRFANGYVAPAPKKEEPKPEPVVTPVVVTVVAPKEEPKPEPVVAPAPVVAPVAEPAAPKVVRIPFPTRMLAAEKDLRDNYNEIKAEAMSYGLKSRVSNSGDTFRLHTKTYLKITIAGKGLKIYYAVNPKDYAKGPIPLKDASGKNMYKEIPGCFKVKSELSVKRAKQLIADAVAKDKLEQGPIEPHNFANELKDYKPQVGGDDDDGGDEDDDK